MISPDRPTRFAPHPPAPHPRPHALSRIPAVPYLTCSRELPLFQVLSSPAGNRLRNPLGAPAQNKPNFKSLISTMERTYAPAPPQNKPNQTQPLTIHYPLSIASPSPPSPAPRSQS